MARVVISFREVIYLNIDYGDIAGQIFAQQPRDLGNLGVDLNANRDALDALVDAGLVDLGSMGIMGAMPSMGGSAPAITEQAQINAAQTYANLVLGPQPTTAEQFADIEKAKQALIDLNVSREQIEAATVTDILETKKCGYFPWYIRSHGANSRWSTWKCC